MLLVHFVELQIPLLPVSPKVCVLHLNARTTLLAKPLLKLLFVELQRPLLTVSPKVFVSSLFATITPIALPKIRLATPESALT